MSSSGRECDFQLCLSFDDVSLVPSLSSIKSRKEPDVSTIVGKTSLNIPIISSPMNTISEDAMTQAMAVAGGGCVVHRYMTVARQVEIFKILGPLPEAWAAVGAAGDYLERARALYNVGVRNFCVDVANGYSRTVLEAIESIRWSFPDASIMAGNVCDLDGVWNLVQSGATAIRVGIGNGSACKTRVVTGHGVPQFSALMDCWGIKTEYPNVSIICDGGVRNSGDCIKALCFSDAIMTGRLLAGTSETPGEPIYTKDAKIGAFPIFKVYAGMASKEGREFNGWFSEENSSFVPEGISTEVPYQGPVAKVLENLVGGIKVGMSYSNAHNLKELRQNAKFIRVTASGHQEGLPRT